MSKLRKMSVQLVTEADKVAADAVKKHNMGLLEKSNVLSAKSVSKRKEAKSLFVFVLKTHSS